MVRGFSVTGSPTNPNSVIYSALGSAGLLSQGSTGNLPYGSRVEIIPWDADGVGDTTPAGTVQVRIDYPFELIANPFSKTTTQAPYVNIVPVRFLNFTITQRATAGEEIYQQ